jgi:hypothetical protein
LKDLFLLLSSTVREPCSYRTAEEVIYTGPISPCSDSQALRGGYKCNLKGSSYLFDAGLAGMPNARVNGPHRLIPRFQRKAWEARQYVTGSDYCTHPIRGQYVKL